MTANRAGEVTIAKVKKFWYLVQPVNIVRLAQAIQLLLQMKVIMHLQVQTNSTSVLEEHTILYPSKHNVNLVKQVIFATPL